jgi:glycosyltransferase involved in cell wall biosynthesis
MNARNAAHQWSQSDYRPHATGFASIECHRRSPPDRIYLYLKHFPAAGMPLRVGTNKAVHGLASGLVANGVAVDVWCEGDRESYTVVPEGYGIHCFESHSPYRTLRLPGTLLESLGTLRPERDLIVLNGVFHPSVYALSRKLRKLRVPYVVAPHGPYHPFLFRKNRLLKWFYWHLLERRLLDHALALQQLDSRHEIWARRLGIKVPIVATENGFSSKELIADEELRWRMSGPVRVLYWGRMAIHTKGLDVLLEGFDLAAGSFPLHLTLQGPDWAGESAKVQQLIAKLSPGRYVTVLPPIFEIPATRVMVAHDIVCMPSRFEGFGLSALEAMLAARVLLVSATAGIAPHIERSGCGVVVEPNALDVLRGFRYLMANRARWREMGLRGRTYAIDNLHWDRIAKRTLTQYQSLLN